MSAGKKEFKLALLALAFLLLLVPCLEAQSLDRKVFSSVGGKTTSGPYYFSFTIGEPVIGTDQNTLPILIKGFEQPIDPTILEAIQRGQVGPGKESLSRLYPIPAKTEITLEYHSENETEKEVYIINAAGQVFYRNRFQQADLLGGVKLQLDGMPIGSYWLICADLGKKTIFPIRKE
ncbi:MAG: hypothetical protein AAGD28_25610 [Bacteroidota bacterium]